jgi:hypothetical protein
MVHESSYIATLSRKQAIMLLLVVVFGLVVIAVESSGLNFLSNSFNETGELVSKKGRPENFTSVDTGLNYHNDKLLHDKEVRRFVVTTAKHVDLSSLEKRQLYKASHLLDKEQSRFTQNEYNSLAQRLRLLLEIYDAYYAYQQADNEVNRQYWRNKLNQVYMDNDKMLLLTSRQRRWLRKVRQ